MPNVAPVFSWDRITAVDGYEVVRADLRNACADAVAVWGNTIGWPGRQEEMYRRYYLECPFGSPEMYFLRHVPTGDVVGTLGVGPRRVFWRGRPLVAGMLSHFCVKREYRRIKPPMLLIKQTVDACRGRYDVLYAMPSTPSAAALGRLFGGAPACNVNRRVKPLRYAKYAARALPRPLARVAGALLDVVARARYATRVSPGLAAAWVERATPGMAAAWAASPRLDGWEAARDLAMLRWRFDRLPTHRRRYLLLSERGSGALVAWFACDANFFDPDILVVQDYWAKGGAAAMTRAAIGVLCREVRALGFAAVEVRDSEPATAVRAWMGAGFRERNHYPVFAAWLSGAPAAARFHITELDNDG